MIFFSHIQILSIDRSFNLKMSDNVFVCTDGSCSMNITSRNLTYTRNNWDGQIDTVFYSYENSHFMGNGGEGGSFVFHLGNFRIFYFFIIIIIF